MTTEKKKKNKVIPIILGVLILLGAIFGIKQYIYYSKHVDTDDAQIDGDISPVVSRVGGYVQDIKFEENTRVNEGDVLVKLDDSDYKIKLEQAMPDKRVLVQAFVFLNHRSLLPQPIPVPQKQTSRLQE